MSIVTCRECQGKVSTLAVSCPHCGAPVTASVETPTQVVANPTFPTISLPSPTQSSPNEVLAQKKTEPLAEATPPQSSNAPALPVIPGPGKSIVPTAKTEVNLDSILVEKTIGVVLFLVGVSLVACFIFDLFDFSQLLRKAKEGSILNYLHRWFPYIVFLSFAIGSSLWGNANKRLHRIKWELDKKLNSTGAQKEANKKSANS